jgi:leucyl-tRNA synthetase
MVLPYHGFQRSTTRRPGRVGCAGSLARKSYRTAAQLAWKVYWSQIQVSDSVWSDPSQRLESFDQHFPRDRGLHYSARHPFRRHIPRIVDESSTGPASGFAELRSFLELSKSFPSDSKAGFRLSNVTAINPLVALPNMHEFPGDGAFALPVYAAPYVLDEYGTGAVMGVPGHDSRDLAFWRAQNPEYPVPLVVSPASKRE